MTHRRLTWPLFLLIVWASLAGLILPLVLTRGFGYAARLFPLSLGWALAVLNALTAGWFARRALGKTIYAWAIWGLFANSLRVALLVMALVFVARFWPTGFNPFATSLICGYFAWLPMEIRAWRAWEM